ncbi:OLC1v1033427C1 [Oldenlandia corymbosa var. corymbosa]|uniref:OLC1v1033427C1 n=1 Tax=Oldenlandia corymbosa var. corymbosa TaxID=529605 RepID=A0AAV1CND8_OLDCO|nr:OLC1v1033427C1 [Oldenlandia corymbosa var. corymbosa]
MGSLSGILQRPVLAASAVAIASLSSDLREKLWPEKSLDVSLLCLEEKGSLFEENNSSWVSKISVSKLASLSFVARIHVPLPTINHQILGSSSSSSVPSFRFSSVYPSPGLINLHQSAELVKAAKPALYKYEASSLPSEVSYRWHLPEPSSVDVSGSSNCASVKSRTVVVLLGWLGAKQKHLNRYAEWYTSRGFHAITFTFPMSEILNYQVGGKAEQDIELLVNHLADWLDEEDGKNLVFHTFSNTGWLTYGVILENLQRSDPSLMGRIKGCVVDSAPVAAPDPQVWASGFSAAFLKKHSVATKGIVSGQSVGIRENETAAEVKPEFAETALLVILRKFFEVVLNLPAVNRRLSDVLSLLTLGQPSCPQLYIYSSADRVIPAGSVESFIERQRKNGREVRACNFISTPHVDHFRNDPTLYSSQLTQFLEDCVLSKCGNSMK